ncbi:MAG: methyltransferase [Thermomicrobiales bacterium]
MVDDHADDMHVPTLLHLIGGAQITQGIHVMARLDVAGSLGDGPLDSEAIARRCGADATALQRLLRALASVGLLDMLPGGAFALTPMGRLLQIDHPQSIHAIADGAGDPFTWDAWGDLLGAMTTGECAFERVHAMSSFAYMQTRPVLRTRFFDTMEAICRLDLDPILDAYDFHRSSVIVDVAGGDGFLLRSILQRYPECRGILYDLPHIVAEAGGIAGTPQASRCTLVGGDMFTAVPSGGDTYLLKLILHDWNDADCVRILRNCREGITPDGRLLVIDLVLQPAGIPDLRTWNDLHMLVMCGGQERTEDEFANLFAQAGFALTEVSPAGGTHIVEGRPV